MFYGNVYDNKGVALDESLGAAISASSSGVLPNNGTGIDLECREDNTTLAIDVACP